MKQNNSVFFISLIISFVIIIFSLFFNRQFNYFSNMLFKIITDKFSWLYLLSMFLFVIYILMIAFTKYGKIKLGDDNSKPEYSLISWFSMLFCAGMGVGLVFWGISEPITHFINFNSSGMSTSEAARISFRTVFMHWGIHPWSAYAVIGLSLAYFQYRKNKPGLISTLLESLFEKNKKNNYLKNVVDIFSCFATVSGIVTSLGFGALQINSGINKIFKIPNNLFIQILIILIVTVIFIYSAISGIDKGVKKLSNINIILAIILMFGAIIIQPKIGILNNLITGIGDYIGNFTQDSLSIPEYGDKNWVENWRVFYWAWWISWAPFVGVFIARISKGRTIREFVLGVVFAPTLSSFIWFSIFGTLGINFGILKDISLEVFEEILKHPESGLFIVFLENNVGIILSIIAIILLLTFFITSADSGTYVLAMLSSDGILNPPNYKKIIWGITQSILAIGLLISGGLKPLQTISIVAAFPFMFIMIATCISLIKELNKEKI